MAGSSAARRTIRPPAPGRVLPLAVARRIALAAQGFPDPRPAGRVDRRHLRRMFDRVGLVQIDSVNVVARSHYFPAYSRLGSYPPPLLDRLAYVDRELFEYWGHEASLLPVGLQPRLRWRMERSGELWSASRRLTELRQRRPAYVDAVLAEITARGPLGAGELSDIGARGGSWWGWHDGKIATEYLFAAGLVSTAGRRGFERIYDLTERVLPAAVLATPTPEPADAQRDLVRVAARALGIATEADLRDYFRLRPADGRARVAELVEAGELRPVAVEGWPAPAYLHPAAAIPRGVRLRTLLSPFDSLVWERDRTERLFGFRYRLEIYTPAAKRVHGYYVLPFLLDDRLVARVDVKADRAAGTLRAQAAWGEPGVAELQVAGALAAELRELADWLSLERVSVGARGDLTPALARALAATGVSARAAPRQQHRVDPLRYGVPVQSAALADQPRWRSDMTIELVKANAADTDVVWAARVSTLGEASLAARDEDPARSRGLINFLMRERHGSPFEHNSMTFLVQAPIFVFREFMRHRIGWSYNEASGRYSELEPVFYLPGPERDLVQEGKAGQYTFVPGTSAQHATVAAATKHACTTAHAAYREMLAAGVAREVARGVLPVATYSAMYATCNARSLMAFLSLRTRREGSRFPSYPQREIEMVAEAMEAQFARLMPLVHAAFDANGRVSP